MAKSKTKINKSKAIRDYVIANPKSSAKDVVNGLAKKKIHVTASTVATVKFKAGLTKSRKRKVNQPDISVDVLVDAKKLRSKAGSIESAIAALKAIDRIESVSC